MVKSVSTFTADNCNNSKTVKLLKMEASKNKANDKFNTSRLGNGNGLDHRSFGSRSYYLADN